MKRPVLRRGDKSTNGGVIIEGVEDTFDQGVELAFIGAKVWCNGCKSMGEVGYRGPHHNSTLMGKQEALDGDICLCKCIPRPVFHASQNDNYHFFDAHDLAEMGYDERGERIDQKPKGKFDERVRVVDTSGRPISGVPYHIRVANGGVVKGVTDSAGYCLRVFTDNMAKLDVAIGMRALERWEV
jgi:uncharacterized Zn-binding protein involved in type VI secretion